MIETPNFSIDRFGLIPKNVPTGPDDRMQDYDDDGDYSD